MAEEERSEATVDEAGDEAGGEAGGEVGGDEAGGEAGGDEAGGERPVRRPPTRGIRAARWARRVSQAVFLALFVYLLIRSSHPVGTNEGTPLTRSSEPVELFFRIDPFAALLTLVSSHRFYVALLPALAVVLLTLVLGRAFCGWVCPLGTLNHVFGRVFSAKRRAERIRRNQPSRWQVVKYAVLAASLGAALLGSAAGGWLDPIAILTRGLGLFALPALDLASGGSVEPAREGLAGWYDMARDGVAFAVGWTGSFRPQRFQAAWLAGLVLLAVLAANAIQPRFWCRALCPLGALLGLIARFSLLGLRKDHAACIDCGRCEVHCQGADAPRGGRVWRESECVLCLNCANACPTRVIDFPMLPHREPLPREPEGVRVSRPGGSAPGGAGRGPDRAGRAGSATGLSRRHLIGSVAAGAALVPLARVGPGLGVADDPRLIRPPGSLGEEGFLSRCIRCGQCMKACPTNAIHPALGEGGVEAIFTPVLIMRIGYCEPSCVTCGQVCPTGAIRPLDEAEKLGRGADREPVRLGTAFIHRGRCLPWAMATPCIVCEEFCPANPKAIWTERAEVETADGDRVTLHRPRVDPSRCTGCGACEFICPVRTPPAISVSSVGESRAPDNRILLAEAGARPEGSSGTGRLAHFIMSRRRESL